MEQIEGLKLSIGLDAARLRSDLSELSKLGQGFGATMTRAFTGAITGSRKLSDVLRSLALSLSRQALSSALRPLGNVLGNAVGGLFGAISANRNGNMIQRGQITPFASGGVVNSPVLFPLRGGTGLAGEAGPEAILPLKRGSDGKLGVNGGHSASVTVTMNISTPDAAGFQRSQTQIAASIARAIERGQRNL